MDDLRSKVEREETFRCELEKLLELPDHIKDLTGEQKKSDDI